MTKPLTIMKRSVLLFAVMLVTASFCFAQNVQVTRAYEVPIAPITPLDSLLRGLASIRCAAMGDDVDNDGKKEVALSNYDGSGHVHVFEAVGNDSLALVWTSPTLERDAIYATPRTVIFGDMDNDGKMEILCDASGKGIYVFEWDGVAASDNYGTSPSFLITAPLLNGSGYVENMEVTDVDADGANELLVAYRAQSSAEQKYCVFNVNGDWSTNDPGFTSVGAEFEMTRASLAAYGVSGGSPVALMAANFDGTGAKEMLLHNWNRKNVTPIRVTGADTYVLADTVNHKQNIYLGGISDDVALFGGLVADIDDDGRDEVYLPTWYGSNGGTANPAVLHMISYPPGTSTSEIDSANNVMRLDLSSAIGLPTTTPSIYNANMLGFGYGDIDGNGKKNVYVSGIDFGSTGFNIATAEFQGGDIRNPSNWTVSLLYKNDPSVLASLTIKDSAGTLDTTKTLWAGQVAKMYARQSDLDGDGLEDILMPYQYWYANPDSVSVTKLTWSGSIYDTTTYKFANSRRSTFRVLERSGTTGVEEKEYALITPEDYIIEQNYPNPFNPSTAIRFSLPVENKISLVVYDMVGREVKTLIANQQMAKGAYQAEWDGTNNAGNAVASGSYVYTLKFGNFSKSQKMMLVR